MQILKDNLEKRLSQLNVQNQRDSLTRENLERAKWTGEKPKDMSDHDFDRLQRSDDYR